MDELWKMLQGKPYLQNFQVAGKPRFLMQSKHYKKLKSSGCIPVLARKIFQKKSKKDNSSERTSWNILNNCPASQRKSLAGLNNNKLTLISLLALQLF